MRNIMTIDFEKIGEIIFFTFVLEETLIFENGIIIDKDNACQFIQNTFDT
jgi:hypothetical protein